MKNVTLLLLLCFLHNANAQDANDIAISQQVDSLIQVSIDYTVRGKFDQALEVNAAAEVIALETFGRESEAYGNCAFNRGRVNHDAGVYQEAEKWYIESKIIYQITIGKEHPKYAYSVSNQAVLYSEMGDFEKAEPLYLEALAIREKVLGKAHPDYCISLNQMALHFYDKGNLDKAEQLLIETLHSREIILGKEHPHYASSLNNLASLYKDKGNFNKAELLYIESKNIREKVLGKEHPSYSGSLNNLALLYWHLGDYDKAEPLYIETLNILEKTSGRAHPHFAQSQLNLANLYWSKGQYEKAEPIYLEATAILEKMLGVEHPQYATSLNNMANLYYTLGNYQRAETLYLSAKNIREKVLGKDHPEYNTSLNNLATLYFDIGNYDRAEAFYLESISTLEKSLGKQHPEYAYNLSNIAYLYRRMGQYQKAEMYHLEALAIRAMSLGKEHPDYAISLEALAMLYNDKGDYTKAKPLFIEALAIREAALGKDHDAYANNLDNLAMLFHTMGDFVYAEIYYKKALAIKEKVLGENHPSFATNLNYQVKIYETQNRYAESELLLQMYFKLTQSRLSQSVTFLSERELSNYTATYQVASSDLISYLQTRVVNNQQTGSLTNLAYNQALFEKGFLRTAASRLNSLTTSTTESQEIMNQLKGYRRRISAEMSKPIAERWGLQELEEKANSVEKELARSVAGYAEAVQQVMWKEVQASLPEHALAIEFVHYKAKASGNSDSIMYAALLIKHNIDQPIFIPLFEQREMDRLLNMEGTRQMDQLDNLYASGFRGMDSEGKGRTPVYVRLGKDRKSIYDLIWKNIEATNLDGIKTIYYSPSGVLHRLNLGAINIDEERILADKYQMIALNSTRSLVIPSSVDPSQNDAVVIGGIEYEMEAVERIPEETALLATRSMEEYWSESGTRGGTWNHLAWTKAEADIVSQSLRSSNFEIQTMTGPTATEETFKSIGTDDPSPRILHIATHGFFFPDPERTAKAASLNLVFESENEPVFKWSDNPMIRSGLILAGGNYAWQNGRAPHPDMEDGILTAYEISQMNLSNTELVVLSACETGLGDIQGNEGVYGLQRAFKIAGAKYLIMSLWQVPDRETMEFMTTFYRNWLEESMTIPEAFRKTQREMRDRFYNPYSWAGFVLVE